MRRPGSRRRGSRPAVKKQALPDRAWGVDERSASVVEGGAKMVRRLFALLELVGPNGAHVSSICEILAVNTVVLDPLLVKLTKAGRLVRVARGVYRPSSPEEQASLVS